MYKGANNLDLKIKNNIFAKEWKKIEQKDSEPKNYRKLIEVEHNEFVSKVLEQNSSFAKSVVESIYNGDLYILKNAISKKNVNHIIDAIYKFSHSTPSTFHKMIEGVPNFHRWIDKDLVNTYSIKYTKQSTYIFPWNEDISDVREMIMEVCRPLKLLAGLSLFELEKNTPKDKIIERLQIARYPPTGFIEPHVDNSSIMRLIISGYLSTRGKDYEDGGFYLIDEKNGKLDMEKEIDAGDVGLFYATLRHGLEPIDSHKIPDINKNDGRWWFGLNHHNSDEVAKEKRHTATPFNIIKNG